MTGGYTPPGSYSAATESWDGSAWTEVSDIATARGYSGAGGSGYASSAAIIFGCLLYTSPSPRDGLLSRMPSSA